MAYSSIIVEGGLFPSDLLDQIATGDAQGQSPADFRLTGGGGLQHEIQSAFSAARSYWDAFQHRLPRSSESRTTLTRQDWMVKLLEVLGYGQLTTHRSSLQVGSQSYFIYSTVGDGENAPPLHIVSLDQSLDRRDGQGRRSPHGLVQEYLNNSDALWGLVSNGEKLRILRNSARVARPTYVEFDLQGMVESNQYSEFAILYRLLHRTRFPVDGPSAAKCLLETYYQDGIDHGSRVREKLRIGVEAALQTLGAGFLQHEQSGELRHAVGSGSLKADAYYRQLLRLVYRLLFLMVAEERKLIYPEESKGHESHRIYIDHYSVSRLRARCERWFAGERSSDLWEGLKQTFLMFRYDETAEALGLSALDGELFGDAACRDLEAAHCTNENLLRAMLHLSTFEDDKQVRRRVNYEHMNVEEFGSVYESLLDFHPKVELSPVPEFHLVAGSERKQTGSYYTPPELVRELIDSALVPVIRERVTAAKTRDEKEQALLDLRVCDPAAGSGHFLLAAARQIARELAQVRADGNEPSPREYRVALRDAIRHCIYAVDKNPLAVDLCKVALWIEGHSAGLPLSFLDHRIKCGDSLVGVADLHVLEDGIPDDAYKAVTGDDKAAAREYRKRNQEEKKGIRQLRLGQAEEPAGVSEDMAQEFDTFALLEELTAQDVQAKGDLYQSMRGIKTDWFTLKVACDLWTAAFFFPKQQTSALNLEGVPTSGTVRRWMLHHSVVGNLTGQAVDVSEQNRFFHWPLEFPEVFRNDGFDVVLGNPPWERIKLQEQEFFFARDPEIAQAPNKAARSRLIDKLPDTNRSLADEFEAAKHVSEAVSNSVRNGGRFPLGGRGDVNTYFVFTELARTALNPRGRAGIIVPSGIASDDTTKYLFGDMVETRSLSSLYDFENREAIFQGVHRSYKFCLLTMTGSDRPVEQAEFAFFLHQPQQLRDEQRRFALTREDFRLINPNTRTCPIFRTRRDAEITRAIYRRVPVLVDEAREDEGNPWGVRFSTMFHMSNDSGLFRTRAQLESEGWVLMGNEFHKGSDRYLPMYEAKMIHQFNHRWATYTDDRNTRDLTDEERNDPDVHVLPRYWVPEAEVESRLEGRWSRDWFVGYRGIGRSTDERTLIACILPVSGTGNSFPLGILSATVTEHARSLVANLSSHVLDFVARFKVGGANLNFFIINQLPVLMPTNYDIKCKWVLHQSNGEWIAPRMLELIYTAKDLQGFAKDASYDGQPFAWNPERRFIIRCELDAAFFHLYGISRKDVAYIMDTFPIVKRRDKQTHGEYRTKRVILETYDAMQRAIDIGQPYQTPLDPPPGDPRAAHEIPKVGVHG